MSDDIEWGTPIYGDRPEWLTDDKMDVINKVDVVVPAGCWMEEFSPYRLPADLPYYLATSKGFTYWPGGESAPADWDGGEVLWSGGYVDGASQCRWDHVGRADIIGYRKLPEQPAPPYSPELVEKMIGLLRDFGAGHLKYDIHDREQGFVSRTAAILSELEPKDPDMALAREIAEDNGYDNPLSNQNIIGLLMATIKRVREQR